MSRGTDNSVWQLYPNNKSLCDKIGGMLSITPLVAQLLLNRGIRSIEDARRFLQPDSGVLPYHFNTDDLQVCADMIVKGLQNQHRIMVIGDYDVDGVTSTTMMVDMLNRLGGKVDYYIPDRFSDGYGLNVKIMDKVVQVGINY